MKFLLIGMLTLTTACAWTPDTVAVQRQALPVAAVPGASSVSVMVTSADARPEREIGHKKNGVGGGDKVGQWSGAMAALRAE